MVGFIESINRFVWGIPALILIICVGVFFSWRTSFFQIRMLPQAIRFFFGKLKRKAENAEETSSYRAVCTALAATVGTGNLAGVAGAICIGGPGAVFWMWICGILGMIIKFAEATLAVRYRQRNKQGEWVGGPMFMIKNGMHKRFGWLAGIYCFFGVIAAFGVGNATQVNTVIGGINDVIIYFGGNESMLWNIVMGVLIAAAITFMLSGGASKIGIAAEKLVPFASIMYLLLGCGVLLLRLEKIPEAIIAIVQGAFSPNAITGGVVGSVFVTVRIGASRGVFTNEAGMGTASIAHGAANVDHPVEQGFMGIIEVFLDTILICTITALVILCSGVEIPYGVDVGIRLTNAAFADVYGEWVCVPITLALCSFAFATVLGWGLYGARCAQFLFGDHVWKTFVLFQALAVVLGAIMKTGVIWVLSETVNGLMAIPNLIALMFLSPELFRLVDNYSSRGYKQKKLAHAK